MPSRFGLSLGSFSRARSHATVARPASTYVVRPTVRRTLATRRPTMDHTNNGAPTSRSVHGFIFCLSDSDASSYLSVLTYRRGVLRETNGSFGTACVFPTAG